MARLHGLRAFLKAHPGLWVLCHSTHSSAVHLNTVICFEQCDCPVSAVPHISHGLDCTAFVLLSRQVGGLRLILR